MSSEPDAFVVAMSVPKRLSKMGADGTELNLDGISKPELEKIPAAKAAELTGMAFLNKLSVSSSHNPPLNFFFLNNYGLHFCKP